MKRYFLLFLSILVLASCKKTKVTPTPEPPKPPVEETPVIAGLVSSNKLFPTPDESFSLIFDPSRGNGALSGFTGDVYLFAGVITNKSVNASDWKYVKYDWNTAPPASTKMTRQSSGKYTFDINPRVYFGVPAGETILKIAALFRTADGNTVARNKDGSDIYLPLYVAASLNVRFAEPEMEPMFDPKPIISVSSSGQEFTVTAYSSQAANLALTLNGASFASAASATKISGKATSASGLQTVKVAANGGVAEASFSFITGGSVQTADLPAGAKENGVTFINNGASAIFAIFAPQKNFVNVIGDFNNWQPTTSTFMKRSADGNTWWVQIDGLDPNKEYSYQYLIDGTLKIADPYSEKILDPNNDKNIPAANNSNFGTYPTGLTTGIVSTLKANQAIYTWQNSGFSRPAKNDLVIYELHLRDFMAANNFKTLKDTVSYLSRLGVNAVELLPITEFEGNSSWGYNPSFYFAPDKYYGTKQELQAFIDACHSKGIAVILDMVLNHSFGQSPMVQLYFDAANQKPAANSPWFNVDPMHPYNVGFDFNHDSPATKTFVKNVVKFWMQEYRVDGFRFDLSKGFTQTNYGTSESAVNAWSSYDAGRIAIWKDYNNFIKSIDPDFYVILEHFAEDREEKELSAEGMMLWNNLNFSFNEASMGWLPKSDFNRGIYSTHGFTKPDNLVSYMESHDEERMMFKNVNYGNTSGSYNIKELNTALKRQELCAAFLFAMPGPKMLWQFGELGYDISIDQNGRTGEKPVLWNYNAQPNRIALRNAFSRSILLKKNNSIFRTTNLSYNFSGPIKFMILREGANKVIVVGNFDVTAQQATLDFGTAGTWYDAANGNQVLNLGSPAYTLTLLPGEYHVFSNTVLMQ